MNAQLKDIIGTTGKGTAKRFAPRVVIAATLVLLLAAAVTGSQALTHRSAPVVSRSVLTMDQYRFLEVNTELGLGGEAAGPAVPTTNGSRFFEVNTNLGMAEPTTPAYPYGETITPVRGPR